MEHSVASRSKNCTPGSFGSSVKPPRKLALYIGGLSPKTTQNELYDYLINFGTISCLQLILDASGASKCCAAVTLKDPKTYHDILSYKKHVIDGKPARITEAKTNIKTSKRISTNCLFIGNIEKSASEEFIRSIFEVFGEIKEFNFFKNASTKYHTKNCIIEYADKEAAEVAFKNRETKAISCHGFTMSPHKKKATTSLHSKAEIEMEEFALEHNHIPLLHASVNPDVQVHDPPYFNKTDQNESYPLETPTPYYYTQRQEFDMKAEQLLHCNVPTDQNNEKPHDGLTCSKSSTISIEDESNGELEDRNQVVTLADLFCEDDLAAAFLPRKPFKGGIRSIKPF